MPFVLVDLVLVGAPGGVEGLGDLIGLGLGYARVVRALEDEERCADLAYVRERGALAIELRVPLGRAEHPLEALAHRGRRRLVERP